MAVSTNSYFSNSIIGTPQVGSDIDIQESSTSPKYPVGYGFTRADGNKYRYCHFGLLSPVSKLCSTDNLESSTTSNAMSLQVVSPTLYTRAGETLAPNAVGSSYIQINNTGANLSVAQLTKDVWAGGTIGIITGSGSGYSYRIKGNAASGNPATGETYIDIYGKLIAPLDTTSGFVVNGYKYGNLEPASGLTAGRYGQTVGFTVVGHTAGSYGWVCTKGVTSAYYGTPACTPGNFVCNSTTTAGAVAILVKPTAGVSTQSNLPMVGVVVQNYSAANYCLVDACLE